jgi:hypothetical protein
MFNDLLRFKVFYSFAAILLPFMTRVRIWSKQTTAPDCLPSSRVTEKYFAALYEIIYSTEEVLIKIIVFIN